MKRWMMMMMMGDGGRALMVGLHPEHHAVAGHQNGIRRRRNGGSDEGGGGLYGDGAGQVLTPLYPMASVITQRKEGRGGAVALEETGDMIINLRLDRKHEPP